MTHVETEPLTDVLIHRTRQEELALASLLQIPDVWAEPTDPRIRASQRWLESKERRRLETYFSAALWYLGGAIIQRLGKAWVCRLDPNGGPARFNLEVGVPSPEGQLSHPFNLPKIRTMYDRAEQQLTPIQHIGLNHTKYPKPDSRVLNHTSIRIMRRLGLDEIPQCKEVMSGNMWFIGPRFLPSKEIAALNEIISREQDRGDDTGNRTFKKYRNIISQAQPLKPGIIGTRTALKNGHISFEIQLLGDIRYLQCASPTVDKKIFINTIKYRILPALGL